MDSGLRRRRPAGGAGFVLLLGLLAACGQAGATPPDATVGPTTSTATIAGSASPTQTIVVPASPTLIATPFALSTAEITQRYNTALDLTEQAIAQTLPTATPIPGMPLEKAAREQAHDLWYRASSTAVALFPPPPEYDPRTLNTPDPPHAPWPTAVIPQRSLGSGTLYEIVDIGPPCNTIRDENSWSGQVAGVKMDLCAGHMPSVRSNAGVLVVCTHTGDPENPSFCTRYYPPPELGSVRIIDMQGNEVVLQSAAGARLIFDLAARQWVMPPPGVTPSP